MRVRKSSRGRLIAAIALWGRDKERYGCRDGALEGDLKSYDLALFVVYGMRYSTLERSTLIWSVIQELRVLYLVAFQG